MKKLILILSLIINAPFIKINAEVGTQDKKLKTENLKEAQSGAATPITTPVPNIQNLYPSFADIVEPLMPAVVNIQIEYAKKTKGTKFKQTPFPEQFFSDDLFDFLERQFNVPFMLEEPKYSASGSGFIIDSSGFIVTNYHVIVDATSIKVKLLDNTEFTAKLIGSDQKTDLALLKIESKTPLAFVKFGKSSDIRVGDWIIAIGNQFGLGGTVTTGIISFKGRDIDVDANIGGVINNFLQTDAAINKGNSGGPMFNLKGEVVGVNTAIYSPSPTGIGVGIGFAIPSDTVQKIVEELKTHGEVVRGTLDITIQEISEEIAEALGLENTKGVLVVEVLPKGAGERAGLKSGDVITKFASKMVDNSRGLQILIAEAPINQEMVIGVIRAGKYLELTAKITKAENLIGKTSSDKNVAYNRDGTIQIESITFSNTTPRINREYSFPENTSGIIVTKIARDNKVSVSLQVGDLILEANQTPLKTVGELHNIYAAAKLAKKKHIMLLVKRRNINIYVAFPLS